jgi:hypothetical protein
MRVTIFIFRNPTAHRQQDDLCIDGRLMVTVAGVDVRVTVHNSLRTVFNNFFVVQRAG